MRKTVLAAAAFVAMSSWAGAAHHEAEETIKAKIKQFYMQMAQGDFDAAFGFVATPSAGFMPYGMVMEVPADPGAATMMAARAKEQFEKGERSEMRPKHIHVKMLGDKNALATYYTEGEVHEDGDVEHMLGRASLVLAKEGDDWKIIHWHISKLETRDEREGDDDDD